MKTMNLQKEPSYIENNQWLSCDQQSENPDSFSVLAGSYHSTSGWVQ